MEDHVPSKGPGRSFRLNARIPAFLVFIIGFLILNATLIGSSQMEGGPGFLIGALIGAGVAALFGLAEWLIGPGPR